jgi:hypothetical protein
MPPACGDDGLPAFRSLSPSKTLQSTPRPLTLAAQPAAMSSQRHVSTTAAKLVRAQSPTKASVLRSVDRAPPLTPVLKGASRAPVRGSKTISGRVQQTRPALADLFSAPKPPSKDHPAKATRPKVVQKKVVEESEPSPKAEQASKSSAALREQIRRAKAERRSLGAKQNSPASDDVTTMPVFEPIVHADPFNQQPKDGRAVLRQRVTAARSDGRLNIAGMGLKEIPEEVLNMYDYEVIKQSGTAWNEVVDLVRFVAADNEIGTIPDEAFPDVDYNSLSQDDDEKGPQFGGVEVLDLHGNVLYDVPRGLRVLERLTTLNLVGKQSDTIT